MFREESSTPEECFFTDAGINHVDGPIVVEIECNVQGRFPRVSNKPMEDGTFKNMPHEIYGRRTGARSNSAGVELHILLVLVL